MSAANLSETNLESGSKAILAEWLASWFDGAEHLVYSGSSGVIRETFPAASLSFDQGPIVQPLNLSGAAPQVEIRVITESLGARRMNEDLGYYADQRVQFNFWVRAKQLSQGSGNANYQANRTCDLLLTVLEHPVSRGTLALKGVTRLDASKAVPYEDTGYSIRLVKCRATLNYKIRF